MNAILKPNKTLFDFENLFKREYNFINAWAEIMSHRKLKKQDDKDYQDCFNEENDSEI